jgi:HAD superfamily hydrolase (TIGR01509 family)
MKHFKGGKVADILSDTISRLQLKISVDDVEPAYRDQVSELFDSQLAPIAGITQALDDLSSLGVDFCVVSNSEKHKIAHSLELTGLLNRFEGRVYSAFEANSWKPDPDILLYAAVSMGYSPSECLYIDDTEKGLLTGLKAGIKTAFFRPNDLSPACETKRDFEISALTDLIKIIQK